MEERILKINLQEARKWYKGNVKELRGLALNAFSKDELEYPQWQSIKTWDDVLNALGISEDMTFMLPTKACYAARVQMIREALNADYDVKLWEGEVWFPYFRIGPEKKVRNYSNFICGNIRVSEPLPNNKDGCLLVGGGASDGSSSGPGSFLSSLGVGYSASDCGSLGCATKEIAEHFGKYFYFEILASWFGDKISRV